MNPVNENRVDELRQQLRALGYLDAGVDRFVLGPARGQRGPLAVAVRASLRVSVLTAFLLGPAAAVGLAGRLPGLVSGVRDALVLAAYLSILFLVGAAVLTSMVTAAAALLIRPGPSFGRRARLASSSAGWLATGGCLGYLTLWWRNANAGFGWSAPVWTTFALVVAVLISLLVGHAVRIATLGVAAAREEGRGDLPAMSRASWRVLVAGAIAFAGCAAVLVLTTSAENAPQPAAALTVVSPGSHVRLIAVDGVDPQLLDDGSLAAGEGLHAIGYRLEPQDTSDPARAWTTIATGEPPDVHGIQGLETRRVTGLRGIVTPGDTPIGRIVRTGTDVVRLTRPSLTTSEQRRSMTFWEVAEQAGLRVAVVNWWATWPAASHGAVVVSDRAVLRLETGGPLDAEIAPADVYASLRKQWPAIRERAARLANDSFGDVADAATARTLRRSAALDATIVYLTDAIEGPPRDLDAVYLPGLDIAQHALLAAGEGAQAPSVVAARVTALRSYYRFLSTLLGPWLRVAGKDVVMLVTGPGRVATPLDGTLRMFEPLWMDAAFNGIRDKGVARVIDIAPTVLHVLGVPLSRELPGRPLPGLFASPQEPRYVDRYGRPFLPAASRTGKPLDQEMIDRLRSLGYVR